MCSLIRNLLADASFRLDINGGLSASIPLLVGLPQGDPLSPVLFLLYIESLCRALDEFDLDLEPPPLVPLARVAAPPQPRPARRGLMTVGQLLRDLLYADDIAALSSSFNDLVRVRGVMEKWGAAWGLAFNPKVGKTEYVAFSSDAAGGFRFPSLSVTLFSGSKKRSKMAFFAPKPAGNPLIPFRDAPGWGDNSHYRYLGLDLTSTLDWTAHWDRAVRGTLYRYNTIAFHRSSVMARMSAARLLQLRKVYLQPYAWSCLSVPTEILAYWDTFLHSTGCAAFHFNKTHASRLLTACLSATPSAEALQLRERLRLFLQLKSHVSRLSPPGFPRHASVTLFDALLRNFSWHARHRTLSPPPNWVADVAAHLDRIADSTPLRVSLGDLNVQWAFQIPDFLRPLTAGVTYFEFRNADARNIKPEDLRMGPNAPRTDGPTRAALSLSFGLSADPAHFMPGSRPLPLSLIGPGCNHIVSLATEVHSDEVLRLIRGNSAFRLPPWVEAGQDGRALAPPVPLGGLPPGANWNSLAGCHLCGDTDGPFHVFGLCLYNIVAAMRAIVTRHALCSFLPFLIRELRRLRLCPLDATPPP
jgi:hypothetical protein